MSEDINHPRHYNHGKIEAIDVIEDWNLDSHLGNALKYICRAGKKNENTHEQDLLKAIWYIQRKIDKIKE